ncbi:MAG TPA: ComEC/Rec2 family competence protein [Hyphomonadaceae bacterium]|nr:ComEC/Rec2 family competence protein [Hyphomonadaceae bacterium]HPN07259.1 ComEC/Rec2 family competence protein [Hyphomonadaceae bacterium]
MGAAFYMSAPAEPSWELLLGATAPLVVAWAWVRRRGVGTLSLLLTMFMCVGIGPVAGKVRTELVAAPVLKEQIDPVRIEGVIAEIDASERSRRVRIDVRAIERLSPEQTPKYVRFSFKGEMSFYPGRAVACRVILSPPPRPVVPGDYEFHRDAWFQQLGAVGFSVGKCEPLAMAPPNDPLEQFSYWLGAVRRAIAEHVNAEAGKEGGGMSAAMVSGDRSFITPDDAEALRLSGLAHLLSISGVHMVLVGGLVFFIIRFLWPFIEPLALRVPSVRAAAFGAIVACTLYFGISGMEVATQRAFIIALIGFGAKLFDRPAISLRSLAIALAVVVLLQPEAVVTPGFQMSFAASGALIALYEMWPKMERPDRPGVLSRMRASIVGAAATSLVASLATMPFALHHFDRAALFSVIANIVSTPVITLWTTPAAMLAALAAPFGVDEPFLWLMGKSMEVVLIIARYSVEMSPELDLPRLGGTGMAMAAVAISLFCVFSRRGRIFALPPAIAAIALWVTAPQAVGYIADDGTVFLQRDKAWLELKDWRADNGLNPLIIGDAIEKAPCMGKGAACKLDVDAGRAVVEQVSAPAPTGCPVSSRLIIHSLTQQALTVEPCSFVEHGGAAIDSDAGSLTLRLPQKQSGRAWTQPLYTKPPKRPALKDQ